MLGGITGLLKRRVSGCIEKAFECLEANSNAQEGIRIRWVSCCTEGIQMLRRGIRIGIYAIQILEDSIWMPATQKSRTTNNELK